MLAPAPSLVTWRFGVSGVKVDLFNCSLFFNVLHVLILIIIINILKKEEKEKKREKKEEKKREHSVVNVLRIRGRAWTASGAARQQVYLQAHSRATLSNAASRYYIKMESA